MNAPAPTSDRLALYHRNHHRQQRVKSLSHLVPAVVLASGIMGLLAGERLTWVVGAEILVGLAYLTLLVRELRHLSRHPHHTEAVAWLEIAAAGILALEGYHIWHRHHEAQLHGAPARVHVLPWLYGALAMFYVWLAFNARRLGERRHLHLHAEGFSGRLHPLGSRFDYRWPEVAAVEPTGTADVLVRRHDGRQQVISFSKMHDGAALRERVLAHAASYLGR